jgi:CRISPR-associated endonuclease Csn1
MKKKLGLDIGTNSIGWAVVQKKDGIYDYLKFFDSDGNPLATKGSYVFPKGVNPDDTSKSAERRKFRGARRRLERIILRKIKTLKVLNEYGLCPEFEEGELSLWKNKKIYPSENEKFIEWQRTGKKSKNSEIEKLKQPYYLRHLAATENGLMNSQDGKLKLGRAFYHMSQRRGYLSNEEEQTEDKLDLFKNDIVNLLEKSLNIVEFIETLKILFENKKSDKDAAKLNKKIVTESNKKIDFDTFKIFVNNELNAPENLGKVMKAIGALTKSINEAHQKGDCAPTLGSYYYSIYAKEDKATGLIKKIRGNYTHRTENYLAEFNYICNKQNIPNDLKEKLQHAIFYQRPLKSQKGLVAMCLLDKDRKRISVSHPLFEEFRMWESLNRIKMGYAEGQRLQFLTIDQKELIKPLFLQKTDFDFTKIAEKISQEKCYCYSKNPNLVYYKGEIVEDVSPELYFNFPMDKKFTACPTTADIMKILGKDNYYTHPLINTGHKIEKWKKNLSIEDIWHILAAESEGNRPKSDIRRSFAEKHLNLDEKRLTFFEKIKLTQGYGSLSKSALKKILPFLKQGEIYTNAVFLANASKIMQRKLNDHEYEVVLNVIRKSLEEHRFEKLYFGIVNECFSKIKEGALLDSNAKVIEAHKIGLETEINSWISDSGEFDANRKIELFNICWSILERDALDIEPREIKFLSPRTINNIIDKNVKTAFPKDEIDVTQLYHPSAMETYSKANLKLGNPEISSIKNPVFNRAMHQIKRLCNELIRRGIIDSETEVNIEMASEINTESYRKALSLWQKEQEIIRTWAKGEIENTFQDKKREIPHITDADIMRFIFWKEQNHQCIYTGDTICVTDFIGGNSNYDIEHTIPRSKFQDNSLSNKTLAKTEFNRTYKKDRLPGLLNENYQGKSIDKESIILNRNAKLRSYNISGVVPTWNVSISTLKNDYDRFKRAAKATADPISHGELMIKVHYTRLKLDYLSKKYKNFECEIITNKFTNANLVDTRIIVKYARAYLNSYFEKVNVVNGKITDTLRKLWGLEGDYSKKDRSNHIHHCIDATVVACIERGTANSISRTFHLYEKDYFKGNDNPKYQIKPPMEDFVQKMHQLKDEVFIYHRQIDRVKPLIKAREKNLKINLRGKLNSQNPYAQIKKNDQLIFAKREPISGITGKDINDIVDEGIKYRLLNLSEIKGWEKLITVVYKENENEEEAIIEHKRNIGFEIFKSIKKTNQKSKEIKNQIPDKGIFANFNDLEGLIQSVTEAIQVPDLGDLQKVNFNSKTRLEVINYVRSKGLELILKESDGVIILPEYYDNEKKKTITKMVIKNIRLKSSKTKLKDFKAIRPLDHSKHDYKLNYFFDKDSNTNYEFQIFGELLPDEKGKLKNRDCRLINHYNIVKNYYDKTNKTPILKLHQDDICLVFDINPIEEIDWNSKLDLQRRLFKVVKFSEKKIIVLQRNSYALGNVDNANAIKVESNLSNNNEVVLRRSASTLKAIPAKIDPLGNIDVDFSKNFVYRNIK